VGQFGINIADVIGFHICGCGVWYGLGPDEPHGSTGLFRGGAEFWSVLGSEGREPEGDIPALHFSLVFVGEEGIPSPGELLKTKYHTITSEL